MSKVAGAALQKSRGELLESRTLALKEHVTRFLHPDRMTTAANDDSADLPRPKAPQPIENSERFHRAALIDAKATVRMLARMHPPSRENAHNPANEQITQLKRASNAAWVDYYKKKYGVHLDDDDDIELFDSFYDALETIFRAKKFIDRTLSTHNSISFIAGQLIQSAKTDSRLSDALYEFGSAVAKFSRENSNAELERFAALRALELLDHPAVRSFLQLEASTAPVESALVADPGPVPSKQALKDAGLLYEQMRAKDRHWDIVQHLKSPKGLGPWLQSGQLTRPILYRSDPQAYRALAAWLARPGNDPVAVFGTPIPTRKEVTDRIAATTEPNELPENVRWALKMRAYRGAQSKNER